MVDVLWLVLADGRDTDGRLSLMEQLLPQGSGPGPHKHTWSDETFYMLDGQITLLVGGEIRTAPMISRHHQKRTRRPSPDAYLQGEAVVQISQFCEVRYCIVQHVKFLVGNGGLAGDPEAKPQTVDHAVQLLRRLGISGAEALNASL